MKSPTRRAAVLALSAAEEEVAVSALASESALISSLISTTSRFLDSRKVLESLSWRFLDAARAAPRRSASVAGASEVGCLVSTTATRGSPDLRGFLGCCLSALAAPSRFALGFTASVGEEDGYRVERTVQKQGIYKVAEIV